MNKSFLLIVSLVATGCCHLSDPGEPGIRVDSEQPFTAIGRVEAGTAYVLKSRGVWRDWFVCTDALGYESKPLMKKYERERRLPEARWFALIGAITETPAMPESDQATLVNLIDLTPYLRTGKPWIASATGTLQVFANDLPSKYSNNKGVIRLQIEARQ